MKLDDVSDSIEITASHRKFKSIYVALVTQWVPFCDELVRTETDTVHPIID